jgi:hypothetical protein
MAAGESKVAGYDDVLLKVVARLIDQIEGANESNCYLSLDPDSLPSNPGDHVYVVAPVAGQFRAGAFIGGGLNHLATEAGCKVAIHCPSLIDQNQRDAVAITDASLSVLRKATAVIAALCHTGAGPLPGSAWVPRVGEYDLTGQFEPVSFALFKHANDAIRSIELSFRFSFDWDMTRR